MFILIYFFVSTFVMILSVFGTIFPNYILLIFPVMGFIFLILDLNRIRRLYQNADEVLIKLESQFKTSKITLIELIGIALVVLFFIFSFANKITKEWLLQYPVNFIIFYRLIYDLYIYLFVRTIFTDKALIFNGNVIKWNNIESYVWQEPRVSFIKGYSKLLIKKKSKFWLGEFDLRITDCQRPKIDELLQRKVGLSNGYE